MLNEQNYHLFKIDNLNESVSFEEHYIAYEIRKTLDGAENLETIKKIQSLVDNYYWTTYVNQIEKENPDFLSNLLGREFRADFGYLKNTIKITEYRLYPFRSENRANDIEILYKTNLSSERQKSTFKDLVSINKVDFKNPILKDENKDQNIDKKL